MVQPIKFLTLPLFQVYNEYLLGHRLRELQAVLPQERSELIYPRTGDQALVRKINLSVILHQVRRTAPVSRASLAQMTGLNKTTVSSLVQELIERKFLREVGYESTGRGAGRPAMLLTLDPDGGYIVSAEIGVDFISVICTNFAPQVIWQQKENISSNTSQEVILDRAVVLLTQAKENGRWVSDRLFGLAAGVPGLVDLKTGTLLFAPNLGWKNLQLRAILEEEFKTLVFVDNEASVAALGEHYFGAAQGYEEVLYVSSGVGLGGGIVHGGHIFRGITGVAGEIGHMIVNPGGELCACGNRGCWETEASQRALFRTICQSIRQGQASRIEEQVNGVLDQITIPMVIEAAQAGDAVSLAGLQKIGRNLGVGIASLVNALNPELVVFGGPLSLAGEFLLPVIEEQLDRCALPWTRQATKVVIAQHGSEACVMGGVASVYQAILADPEGFS